MYQQNDSEKTVRNLSNTEFSLKTANQHPWLYTVMCNMYQHRYDYVDVVDVV